MHRLSSLDDKLKQRIGWASLVLGLAGLALGSLWAHYAGFPESEIVDGVAHPLVVDYLGWIPRGWISETAGMLVGFGGSQLLLLGAIFVWVEGKPHTWTRATFAAFIVWIELVIIFGIVPSEWLNVAQGPLEWTSQRIAFTIPSWLLLGNHVDVSLGTIKEAIMAGYVTNMLVVAIVAAYKLQDWGSAPDKPQALADSSYGRPMIRGDA